jgi:hypothetical protein
MWMRLSGLHVSGFDVGVVGEADGFDGLANRTDWSPQSNVSCVACGLQLRQAVTVVCWFRFAMLFIPLIDRVLLPVWIRHTSPSANRCLRGLAPSALRRMGLGMVFAAASFVIAAILAASVESAGDGKISVMWLIPQYAALTVGEILTSATGMLLYFLHGTFL